MKNILSSLHKLIFMFTFLTNSNFTESTYSYVDNNPIFFIDPNGKYKYPANSGYEKKYSVLTNYLKNGIGELLKQQNIRDGLKVIGSFTDEQIDQLSKFDDGLEIRIIALDTDEENAQGIEHNGYAGNEEGQGYLEIDQTLAKQLQDAKTSEDKEATLLAIISTILHETTHHGLNYNDVPMHANSRNISIGKWKRTYDRQKNLYTYYYDGREVGNSEESGYAFELAIWYNETGRAKVNSDRKQGERGKRDNRRKVKENKDEGRQDHLPKVQN